MQFTETCIKRPVFTSVISLMLITLGAIFYTKLEVRDTPNVNSPSLTVEARYEGADGLYMEKKVTTPLERVLKTVKNLEIMTSQSSMGTTYINLKFKADADIEVAINDVRSKIADIGYAFPDDMRLPSVSKTDRSNQPSIWISISSARYDNLELTKIVENQIKPVLERIPAVGEVQLEGAKYYHMHIEPIDRMMFRHSISPIEIEQAIRSQNRDYPAGTIKTTSRSFSLKINSSLQTKEDFENIFIKKYEDDTVIKLKDVAKVSIEPYEDYVIMRTNGHRAMAIGIVRQSTANDIQLSNGIKEELQKIKTTLPPEINIEILYDGSIHIRESIKSVAYAILEAILLVGLIIFLFLGSLRLTLIPLVTIPISLIGTFSAMYMLGFSINFFTLLAMMLAIGLVVDDAIVMLENIFRHRDDLSKTVTQAAIDGSKEIIFAVVAMTITLAAVFLPVGFVEGYMGKMFIEFAWTLAFCILLSGVVALTLTPMMTSRMLAKTKKSKSKYLKLVDGAIEKIQSFYINLLKLSIKRKLIFYIICLASIVGIVIGFKKVEKVEMPNEDIGILAILYSLPEGSNMYETEKSVIQAEKYLAQDKDIDNYTAQIWGDRAFSFVPLRDWKLRKRSQDTIRKDLNDKFSAIPSASIHVFSPMNGGGRGTGAKVEFNLQSSLEYNDLDFLSSQIMDLLKKNPLFRDIQRDFDTSQPTIDLIVNRDKAYLYGTSLDAIGNTIQYLIAGKKVGDFNIGTEIYSVIIRYNEAKRNTPESIKSIFVKTAANFMLPLESVVEIKESNTIKTYNHYNCSRSVTFKAYLAEETTLEQAINAIDTVRTSILNPNDTMLEYLGTVKDMHKSNKNTMIIFLLALVFIFLVLAAQFESFGDSFLILMSVPFSITGGILGLWLFKDTLNMYSNIGFVSLIGLVTKNSIMIVEFANQLREQGYRVKDAIIEASRLRLRPILMTSIATMLGAVPLVFSTGAGAGSRHSIGMVVVCGMLLGTVFTIFAIPVLYQTFKRDRDK
jgi:HAE1 family hydrophobic/amphiphilic exporter-1